MISILPLSKVCTDIIDCPHESPKWLNEGIPVIRNFNLINGQFDMTDASYVDEETYKRRTRRATPEAGDIIFSREAPIGNCAIVPENYKCCLGQRLVLLKVNHDVCSSEYLLAALLSNFVKDQIAQVAKTGSIVSNFAVEDLKNLSIPIIVNQEDAAIFSSTIHAKLSNNNYICKCLKDISKLIYDYWFVQFDFPDEEGKPYRTNGGEMIWNECLNQEIPKNWEVKPIGSLIKECKKSTVQVGDAYGHNGMIPFFTSGEEIIMFDTPFTSGKSIFFNTGGNADVKYYIGEAAYSTDTWCITADEYTTYLYEYFESIRQFLSVSFFAGSGLKHLQKDVLKEQSVIVPPKELICKYNVIADLCFERISNCKLDNQQLIELNDFILPMIMNGQVTTK